MKRLITASSMLALCAGMALAQKPAPAADERPGPFRAELDHREPAAPNTNATIVTEDGPVKGVEAFGVNAWLGIPYAAPPVGNLRWMPPQRHEEFHGVFQANTFGSACTQGGVAAATITGSEDCLTLNVFTPPQKNRNEREDDGLPVMVWIHGGGLLTGGSSFYDPSPMVTNGKVIVVTINYRLGFLGFFAHPAIDAEGHLKGNYGLMDQQFALKWVKRNIGAFGGDPERVTIFGESAGGQSVYANLASPTAAGMFQRAIAESGAYFSFQDYFNFIVPLAGGETAGTGVAAAVGCSGQTAQCLRAVPASTLGAAVGGSALDGAIFPFVDGTILTQTPAAAFASGRFNRVPVISGGNHDEGRSFVATQYDFTGHPLISATDYHNALQAQYGAIGFPQLVAPIEFLLYPLASYSSSPGVAFGASATDSAFACPERNSVRSLSKYVTTYAYEFNDRNTPDFLARFTGVSLLPEPSFPLGAYHAAELAYLFDLYPRLVGFNPFTADQQQLSNTMIRYWTEFAATGNPNFPGAPVWLPYNSAADQFQSLVPPMPSALSGFSTDHKCSSFWNTF